MKKINKKFNSLFISILSILLTLNICLPSFADPVIDGRFLKSSSVDLTTKVTGTLPTGNGGFSNELVDDRINALILGGTGISWAYDDALGTFTPTVTLSPFSTTNLSEGTGLYFTNARGIASTLTGFSASAGTVTSSDSILSAFNKVLGNIALKADLASPVFTGTVTTPNLITTGQAAIGATAVGSNIVLYLEAEGASEQPIRANRYTDTAANGPWYVSGRARGTSVSPTKVLSGDVLGGFTAAGYWDSGVSSGFAGATGSIRVFAGEDFSLSTTFGTYLGFGVTSIGSTSRTDKMFLDTTGELTIGTVRGNASGTAGKLFVGAIESKGLISRYTIAGITASVTQTQGQGALTADINQISTVANTNDTVTLPSAAAGYSVTIINSGANTLKIFPASADAIGALGVNNPTTLAAGGKAMFTSYDTTNWIQMI